MWEIGKKLIGYKGIIISYAGTEKANKRDYGNFWGIFELIGAGLLLISSCICIYILSSCFNTSYSPDQLLVFLLALTFMSGSVLLLIGSEKQLRVLIVYIVSTFILLLGLISVTILVLGVMKILPAVSTGTLLAFFFFCTIVGVAGALSTQHPDYWKGVTCRDLVYDTAVHVSPNTKIYSWIRQNPPKPLQFIKLLKKVKVKNYWMRDFNLLIFPTTLLMSMEVATLLV